MKRSPIDRLWLSPGQAGWVRRPPDWQEHEPLSVVRAVRSQ